MIYPSINLKATGNNIKYYRKKSGVTVKQMQNYLMFNTPQAIYKWQRGECMPTIDNLVAISKLLRVSIDEIIIVN